MSLLVDRWNTAGYQGAGIWAFAALALVFARPIEIGAAIAGTALLVGSRALPSWDGNVAGRLRTLGFVAAALLLATSPAWWGVEPAVGLTTLFAVPFALAFAYLAWRGEVERARVRFMALALLLALIGIIGVLWITIPEPPDIDVLHIHVSGADALMAGENPYVTARAPNTSPDVPEGSEFVGYTYPPLVLFTYPISDVLFGDARWASVIAIAATVALIIRPWVVMERVEAGAAIALALAVAVQPALGWVFNQAWTDPLALPLLLGCGLLWKRNPALAAVLLGLAFGTKQYFLLALPLLLLWPDDYRWKRLGISVGVAVLSLTPALLDPIAYWNATVVPSLDAPTRLDSAGLAGLGLDLPLIVVALVSLGVALWVARGGGLQTRFLLAAAATLATAFLIGFQAFIPYWFFVGNLALVAVAAGGVEDDRAVGRDSVAAIAGSPS